MLRNNLSKIEEHVNSQIIPVLKNKIDMHYYLFDFISSLLPSIITDNKDKHDDIE